MKRTRNRIPPFGLALILLLSLAMLLGLLFWTGVYAKVLNLLQWMQDQSPVAQLLLFIAVMAAVVVLVLPGVLFTLGAGFMFGVVKGTVFVVLGTTVGASLAFLIARHTFAKGFRDYLLSHPKLKNIDRQCVSEGWKIVLATRLIPFFPFKISNYFFGLTSFSFGGFVVGTCIGIVPYSLYSVYLGSIAASLTDLTVANSRTPTEWIFYGAGFVLTLLALVYFRRLAANIMTFSDAEGDDRATQFTVKPVPNTDYRDYI